jgi:multisubunit Na+/H+ antiporter MnhC subunit
VIEPDDEHASSVTPPSLLLIAVAVAQCCWVSALPRPNRLAIALGLSVVSVAVELFLHASGTFHWE